MQERLDLLGIVIRDFEDLAEVARDDEAHAGRARGAAEARAPFNLGGIAPRWCSAVVGLFERLRRLDQGARPWKEGRSLGV